MKRVFWRMFPLGVFALLAVFFWRGLSLDPRHLPSMREGKPLPPFSMPVLGQSGASLTQATLQGQFALLNVWASWCSACVEEQVFLMQLARQGIAIYGLNYKDEPSDASRWLEEWGNPYTMVGEDTDGKVAIDLGVYGAPETFLIDKSGVIRYRHVGILTARTWEQAFLPRIKALEHSA